MDARAGVGSAWRSDRSSATPPKLSVPEYLVSPEAAPVRRLPIGAEPQSGGGVHFRVWAPRCREVAVEIEGLEPAALQSETRRLLLTVEPAGASRHALSFSSRSG